jgi:hypothetical protein
MRSRISISIICLGLVVLVFQIVCAQTKKRLIHIPNLSIDNVEGPVLLEVVGIKIAGKPIAVGAPFDASDNWLGKMTLSVKNIGPKPIVAFGVGGGLLQDIDEELPPYASFYYAIDWKWGKPFNPDKEKHHGPVLKVGDTVELSYFNVSSLSRRVLAKEGEGVFCKLKFGLLTVQFADGDRPSKGQIRFRKMV